MINAHKVANSVGLKGRTNSVMQTCFFAISGILPQEKAVAHIKHSIEKTYGKRGEAVVQKNFQAVDETLAHLHEVPIPVEEAAPFQRGSSPPMWFLSRRQPVAEEAPDFVRNVLGKMIAGEGDTLPVSTLPCDGTYPSATARWEKQEKKPKSSCLSEGEGK